MFHHLFHHPISSEVLNPACKLGLQGERNEQEYDRRKAKHIPIREEEIYLTNVFMHIKFSKNAPLNQEKTILHYFTKLCLNRASLVWKYISPMWLLPKDEM